MRFFKAIIEFIDVCFADNKKSSAGKKAGGALAKKSLKKLRRVI